MGTKFNISLSHLIEWLLPVGLRSGSVRELLRAAFTVYQSTTGRKDICTEFAAARVADRFKLAHNGQVCYLRSALNQTFKSQLKGVYFRVGEISGGLEWLYASKEGDTPAELAGHIYAQGEAADRAVSVETNETAEAEQIAEPAPIKHIYAPSEVKLSPTNAFIIFVPSDLYATQLDKIKQFVNEYRLVTRTPQYEPINS